MLGDASTVIRVLLWMAPGMQREIVNAALREEQGILVLEADASQPEWSVSGSAAALRTTVRKWSPNVVVLSAPSADIRRLVGETADIAAVFVSTDGRSALSYDGDVSAGGLVRMVRSVASRAPHD